MQEMLHLKMNFTKVEGHEKYLSLPTYRSRSKKVVFQVIQDRVWKKVKGWKERYLSRRGREILLKSVAQAIPTYAMQCFKIPDAVINNINVVCKDFWWGQNDRERKLVLISWEKMCKSKIEGGLGLRDMRAFNSVLLAKQCWRIVENPYSLAARVLKGKYFPCSSFWDAKIPPTASYTWRSITSARDLLKEGSSWVEGNGRNEEGHKFWNVGQGLSEIEIQAIQKIRLLQSDHADFLQWKDTKNGMFSVRSTYHLELQRSKSTAGPSHGEPDVKLWKKIWEASVPPKVKSVMWRAVRNRLPVRQVLCKRGMQIDPRCPRCGEENETIMHLIAFNPESHIIWKLSPLRLYTDCWALFSVKDWCTEMMKKLTVDKGWEIFLMFWWKIWELRHLWTFEKKKLDAPVVCKRTLNFLGEFEAANARDSSAPSSANNDNLHSWKPSPPGMYMLNTDVALSMEGKIGLGMVVRDNHGDVMMAGGRLLISSDCLHLINLLQMKSKERTPTQLIVDDILYIASLCDSSSFMFQSRLCNKVAHSNAKLSLSLSEEQIWMEECSPTSLPFVISDKVDFDI